MKIQERGSNLFAISAIVEPRGRNQIWLRSSGSTIAEIAKWLELRSDKTDKDAM
jgi:hypothetical protein